MTYRSNLHLPIFLFIAASSIAQPPPQADFAVASVRPNLIAKSEPKEGDEEKITLSPGSLIMWNVTLRSCLRWAYDLRDYQIVGPSWLASEHYDISAKASGPVPTRDMRQMLQRLLVDRFHMIVRIEAKELPVYAMSLSTSTRKRDRLKPSTGDQPVMKPVDGALEFRAYLMADLAERLATRPFKLDRMVIDKTALDGRYDFKVEFASDGGGMKGALEAMELNTPGAPSMLPFLQDQLGLVFKAQKAPIDSLIIDHAERIPSGN